DGLAGLGILDDGAHRHAQLDILAGPAVAVGAHAFDAVLGAMDAGEPVVDERVDVAVGARPDAAALAAVAAVRPAARYRALAAKRSRAVTAFAGVDLDPGFIDEFHLIKIK